MRISAYLLATGLQPLWAYVNTKDNPADKPSRLGNSEKMVKKVSFTKEARTKEGRKKIREKLGTLKSLTVQDKTKARYKASLDDFFSYLRAEGLQLPTKREFMDDLISDYLEYLWAQGEGRAVGSTFLAALQDHDPKLKHNLPPLFLALDEDLDHTWGAL